jgi:Protein of unknown function (DUF4232)
MLALLGASLALCLTGVSVSPSLSGAASGAAHPGVSSKGDATGMCVAADLAASGGWQGATGSMAGEIFLENLGPATCALRGYPRVVVRDAWNDVLPVHVVDGATGGPPTARRHPGLVTLAPQQQEGTGVMVQWFNWCGDALAPFSLMLSLPGGGRLWPQPINTVDNFSGRPRCDEPSRPSTMDVGPISVASGSAPSAPQVPVGTHLCASGDLTVHGGRQGESGTALGTVVLTNVGADTCVLSGQPVVALATTAGHVLSVLTLPPQSPRTSPLLVRPDRAGQLDVDWSNWCAPPPGPLDVDVTVAGSSTTLVGPFDGPPAYDLVPPCQDSTRPSTLTLVSAFGIFAASSPQSPTP